MVDPHVLGLHHVTAIARDAQTNLDFYTGVLGLRLVKLTVNFDDPTSYHLYYGDATGRPGSILTFFAYDGRPGALGLGQATATAFSIPPNTLEFWTDRLSGHGISTRPVPSRLGETGLALADPDGMRLELIEHDEPGAGGEWIGQIVETAKAITGLHSVTIPTASEATGRFLDEVFGWDERTVDASTKRFHGENPGRSISSRPPTPLMGGSPSDRFITSRFECATKTPRLTGDNASWSAAIRSAHSWIATTSDPSTFTNRAECFSRSRPTPPGLPPTRPSIS